MNLRVLLSLSLIVACCSFADAQQRKCEMAIKLLSPSQSQVIAAYAQYNLTVRITNNGPDNLLQGDTLWYNTPSMPLISYATFILQQGIDVGNSANITLETDVNNNTNTQDETATFYATVVSRPDGMGALKDTFLTNNTDADTVTFKACNPNGSGGTSIHSVNAKDLQIHVYPNPGSGFIRIETGMANMTHITVADISGRTVASKDITVAKGNTFELNISNLNAGMYFIKMETDKGIGTTKFIKN